MVSVATGPSGRLVTPQLLCPQDPPGWCDTWDNTCWGVWSAGSTPPTWPGWGPQEDRQPHRSPLVMGTEKGWAGPCCGPAASCSVRLDCVSRGLSNRADAPAVPCPACRPPGLAQLASALQPLYPSGSACFLQLGFGGQRRELLTGQKWGWKLRRRPGRPRSSCWPLHPAGTVGRQLSPPAPISGSSSLSDPRGPSTAGQGTLRAAGPGGQGPAGSGGHRGPFWDGPHRPSAAGGEAPGAAAQGSGCPAQGLRCHARRAPEEAARVSPSFPPLPPR